MEPAGRDPGRAFGAPAVGPVTLCSQKKSSPFRTIFSPAWGMGPWTMSEVECRPRNYLGDYPYRPSPPQQCPRNYLGSGPRGPPILIVVLQLLAAELVCCPPRTPRTSAGRAPRMCSAGSRRRDRLFSRGARPCRPRRRCRRPRGRARAGRRPPPSSGCRTRPRGTPASRRCRRCRSCASSS